MQRLVKCCLRAAFSSAGLQLPAKGMQAPRTVCEYSALDLRFTAHANTARWICVLQRADIAPLLEMLLLWKSGVSKS
jgi:hypothetical protein